MTKDKDQRDEIAEVVEDKLPSLVSANALYDAFIGMTNIEHVQEEDFVMKNLLRGKSKNWVITQLENKHPDYSFSYNDLEKFLSKNPEIVEAMGKKAENAVVRYFNSKQKMVNKIASLAAYTEQLIPQLRHEADNANAVSAIRAYKDILKTYMDLEGYTKSDVEGGKVVNIIQQMSEDKSSSLKDRIHNANFSNFDDNDGVIDNGKVKDK